MKNVTLAVRPGFLYKNERYNNISPDVSFPCLSKPDGSPRPLCPVTTLKRWLSATKDFQGHQLFFNLQTLRPLKASLLSQMLCRLINTSQKGTFPKGHDIRKVATSLAWTRGIGISEVVKRAFWKSSNVFIKTYLHNQLPNHCVALGSTWFDTWRYYCT